MFRGSTTDPHQVSGCLDFPISWKTLVTHFRAKWQRQQRSHVTIHVRNSPQGHSWWYRAVPNDSSWRWDFGTLWKLTKMAGIWKNKIAPIFFLKRRYYGYIFKFVAFFRNGVLVFWGCDLGRFFFGCLLFGAIALRLGRGGMCWFRNIKEWFILIRLINVKPCHLPVRVPKDG